MRAAAAMFLCRIRAVVLVHWLPSHKSPSLLTMTRHRVLNPKTGRMVFAIGAIGRALKKPKPANKKAHKPRSCVT